MNEIGWVLAAVKDCDIISSGYYQGNGEWGQECEAKVYHMKKRLREGRVEALKCKPERADDVFGFAVYLHG